MADQATIDQLRTLLGQLTAEQDQQKAAEENAKRDEQLSAADRITMIRAEQALNGKSVSADQLEHVLRILEGLADAAPKNSSATAAPPPSQRTPRAVGGDVPPEPARATGKQPRTVPVLTDNEEAPEFALEDAHDGEFAEV